MNSRPFVTALLLPSLLAGCESPRGGEDRDPDGTPAAHEEERANTAGGRPAGSGAETPETHDGAAAAAAATPADPNDQGMVDTVVRIGVFDGDDTQVFGRIREIAIDDSANVYVLDDQAMKLSWFDRKGTFRGAAGRAGGGPGEFRAPTAIAVDDRGRIQVLDVAHRRISTFAPTDTALNLVEEFTIPFFGVDFCRLDGRYFFLSVQDGGFIHEVATDGTILRSFGELPIEIPDELQAHAQLLRDSGARGRLACVSDPPVVVLIPEMIPRVQAFNPDGGLLWSATLADYHQRRWEFKPPNGVRMAPDPATGSAHTAMDASLMSTDLIAITLHEGSVADPVGSLELRTLSLEDGSEREPRKGTGILAGVLQHLEYSYVNSPFPQITIMPTATQK